MSLRYDSFRVDLIALMRLIIAERRQCCQINVSICKNVVSTNLKNNIIKRAV